MKRKVLAGVIVCAALGGGLATRTIIGQAPASGDAPKNFSRPCCRCLRRAVWDAIAIRSRPAI